MTLGPLMVDVEGALLSPDDIDVLSHPLVGSVLLYTRNYRNPKQISELCAAIRALRTPHFLIATDHEGGRVQRFREGFTALPAARLIGRRFDEDRQEGLRCAHSVGWLLATELRAVGVDFSFAPCVDLDYGLSEVIGDRAFHRDCRRGRGPGGGLPRGDARSRDGRGGKAFSRSRRGARRLACGVTHRPARTRRHGAGSQALSPTHRESAPGGHGGPRRVSGRRYAACESLAALARRGPAREPRFSRLRLRR